MASDESRRVADYFVVCGLPKNNPQLLDDSSLEVSLRSTAHQDPITDITVSDILSSFRYIGIPEHTYIIYHQHANPIISNVWPAIFR